MSLPIPTGVVVTDHYDAVRKHLGAASELRASVHLIEQGFDVYRCVSPHAAFDLVAHRDGELYRVEVKTISRRKGSTYVPTFTWPVNDEWDLLVLCADTKIFQFVSGVTKDEARRFVASEMRLEGVTYPSPTPKGDRIVDRVEAVFRDCPSAEYSKVDMLSELLRRGWTEPDGTTSPRVHLVGSVLITLYDKGIVDRVSRGVYRLARAAS